MQLKFGLAVKILFKNLNDSLITSMFTVHNFVPVSGRIASPIMH